MDYLKEAEQFLEFSKESESSSWTQAWSLQAIAAALIAFVEEARKANEDNEEEK